MLCCACRRATTDAMSRNYDLDHNLKSLLEVTHGPLAQHEVQDASDEARG